MESLETSEHEARPYVPSVQLPTFAQALAAFRVASGYLPHEDDSHYRSVGEMVEVAKTRVAVIVRKGDPKEMNRGLMLKSFVKKWEHDVDLLRPPKALDSCERCRFYLRDNKDEQDNHYGLCRRHPPQAIVFVTDPANYQTVFPVMSINGWCGEFAE